MLMDQQDGGIIFANGYIEVEEGPHESVGFMNGKINGVEVSARGKDVPRIPDEYWHGEMTINYRNSSMVLLINIKISLKSHLDI
jgi:hypothetical protein